MAERVVQTRFPMSTADAEGAASIRFEGDRLLLSLRDYQSRPCAVEFSGVVGFRWTRDVADERAGLRDDEVYEIQDSEWVRGLAQVHSILSPAGLRHLLIGFNEESAWLEVVCGAVREVA